MLGLCAMGVAAGLQASPANAQDDELNRVSNAPVVAAVPSKPASGSTARSHAAVSTPASMPRAAAAIPAAPAASAAAGTTAPVTSASTTATTSGPEAKPAKKPEGQYYVDFRARTAASYGH